MSTMLTILSRQRLILSVALLLALTGALAWLTMPRQEDPKLPERWGLVTAVFPGADPETIERLVLEPLEENLFEVPEVDHVTATVRTGFVVAEVQLDQTIYDVDAAWDEVRRALDRAREDFPEGVSEPALDDEVMDTESIVVAISGSSDPLELSHAADRLEHRLLLLPGVKKVHVAGDPDEQVTIELDDATARRLGVGPRDLAAALEARNTVLPGGSLRLAGQTAVLSPRTEFLSIEEIEATPVLLASGTSVPLASVARVRRSPAEPTPEMARANGVAAIVVSVVPEENLDLVDFGARVREEIAAAREDLAPLTVEEFFYQPGRVETRLSELGISLLTGMLIVAGILVAVMGVRLGLTVSSVIPLVAFSSLAVYAAGGGVLQQMSIAALVIALGMLVDNAIVVAESIQYRLDAGEPAGLAAQSTVRELAMPLLSATGTTLAAFVPMLISQGDVGDFTRAIPVVIMLTLAMSYVFAIFVTPSLGALVLRPSVSASRARRVESLGRAIGSFAVRRPLVVLGAVGGLVAASIVGASFVDRQFFPAADRNQLVVDIELPEGTPIEETDRATAIVERALLADPSVSKVAAFVGRNAPKFYYNLASVPSAPHFAQVAAETARLSDVPRIILDIRALAHAEIPEARVVPRLLEQGPPVVAPVEIRLYGDDLAELQLAAEAIVTQVREIPGTVDVRHDMGIGMPRMNVVVDDAEAARRGLSRADVALALYGRTRGLHAGQYRAGDDPVPIVVRSKEGEELPAERLATIDVAVPGGAPVPLSQIARSNVAWRPAAISHRDGRRIVLVLSQLETGVAYGKVTREVEERIAALELPESIRVELGGDASESSSANRALLSGLPLGVVLLLGFLLAEFNSFRRVLIVLVTIPLAATGVVPGLFLAGEPFGFMSLLGVIALVGIVVNNAIVLIDRVETQRAQGSALKDALVEAVGRRLMPILLTTGTTVAGLIPLALSPTSLWPPLAWAIISGLLASTLLTLAVVPALYLLFFGGGGSLLPAGWRRATQSALPAAGTVTIAALLLFSASIGSARAAEPVTLADAIERAAARPSAEAARAVAEATAQGALAERRGGFLPVVGGSAAAFARSRDLALQTPIGTFQTGGSTFRAAEVTLRQPLVDVRHWRYVAPASKAESAAESANADRTLQELAREAASIYLDVLSIDASLAATDVLIASLEARLAEVQAAVAAGRLLESERLKIVVARDVAAQERRQLMASRGVALRALAQAIGATEPVDVASVDGDALAALVPALPAAEDALVARALEARPDLAALRERERALELRARAVRAEALPTLVAEGRATWDDSGAYDVDSWSEGRLALTFSLFEAGTRGPRRAALESERRATLAQLEEARRGIQIEIARALADLDVARGAVEVGRSAVADASETLRVEEERHRAGRATTNDLLEAQAIVRERRTDRDLASLAVMRAWIDLQTALGTEPRTWLHAAVSR